MVAKHTLPQGAGNGVQNTNEQEQSAGHADIEMCQQVLLRLSQRSQANAQTTIRDLHGLVGSPLHDVFAALRTLEYGKIIDIIDNPGDPFGAIVRVRQSGQIDLQSNSAA